MSALKAKILGLLRGHWPRFWAELKLKIRVWPCTFRGIVLHQIGYVREPFIVRMLDKLEARNLCREKSATVLLPKLYQVASHPDELDPKLWPEEFVIKPSHGSGALVIVTKETKRGLNYDIELGEFRWNEGTWGMLSSSIDLTILKALGEKWLESNYEYWSPKTPEWGYGQINPKLLVEELIANSDGISPIELRFHCFYGRAQVGRITETQTPEKTNWTLDRDGVPLRATIGVGREGNHNTVPIPPNWIGAVAEAEKLAQGYRYVRVDLYSTESGIYFSEFTPYPFAGNYDFRPKSLSRVLAKIWRSGVEMPLPSALYFRN